MTDNTINERLVIGGLFCFLLALLGTVFEHCQTVAANQRLAIEKGCK